MGLLKCTRIKDFKMRAIVVSASFPTPVGKWLCSTGCCNPVRSTGTDCSSSFSPRLLAYPSRQQVSKESHARPLCDSGIAAAARLIFAIVTPRSRRGLQRPSVKSVQQEPRADSYTSVTRTMSSNVSPYPRSRHCVCCRYKLACRMIRIFASPLSACTCRSPSQA